MTTCTDCESNLAASEVFWMYRPGYGPGSTASLREKCEPLCRECVKARRRAKRKEATS